MVGAIETRSLPGSLAAARRGFTFYLADPSARLKLAHRPTRSLLPSRLYLLSRRPLGSIETRSAPALTRCYPRNFTFYLADPSARLTTIALGGSGEPLLPAKRRTLLFLL